MNHNLTELTKGERLWLWRRNQLSPTGARAGRGGRWMTAGEAAELFNYTIALWCDAENDVEEFAAEALLQRVEEQPPTIGDLCLIARRRSARAFGTRLALMDEICNELNMSRPTFNKLERAGDPLIVRFWQARGFQFPKGE